MDVNPYMSLVVFDDEERRRKGKLARALEAKESVPAASASAQVIEAEEAAAAAPDRRPEKRRKTQHLHPIFLEMHQVLCRHIKSGFDDVFTIITDSLGSGQLPALRLFTGLDCLGHKWAAKYIWNFVESTKIRNLVPGKDWPNDLATTGALDLAAVLAVLAFECVTECRMRVYISAARLAADQPYVVRFDSVCHTEVYTTAVCPGCFAYDQTAPRQDHLVYKEIPKIVHHANCPQTRLWAEPVPQELPWLLRGGSFFLMPSAASIRQVMHRLFDNQFYGRTQPLDNDGNALSRVFDVDVNNAEIDRCLIVVSVTDLID